MDERMQHKNVKTTEAIYGDERIGISIDLYGKLQATADQAGTAVEVIVAEAIADKLDELKTH